jgi:hypothetical protein
MAAQARCEVGVPGAGPFVAQLLQVDALTANDIPNDPSPADAARTDSGLLRWTVVVLETAGRDAATRSLPGSRTAAARKGHER